MKSLNKTQVIESDFDRELKQLEKQSRQHDSKRPQRENKP